MLTVALAHAAALWDHAAAIGQLLVSTFGVSDGH